jgi:8-oxo-dGTP pyrophosphatase MutT (NUDIX family)
MMGGLHEVFTNPPSGHHEPRGRALPNDQRHGLPKPLKALLFPWWALTRGALLGVRGAVFDGDGRVLLVRHSYVTGWHFPGGGVEVGETMLDALGRECREEAGVILDPARPPRLHGVFLNRKLANRDHIGVFVVTAFDRPGAPRANAEIRETGFFAPDALPAETTDAVRRRLAEIASGSTPDPEW